MEGNKQKRFAKIISIRLYEPEYIRLKIISENSKRTISEIIRSSIYAYLKF